MIVFRCIFFLLFVSVHQCRLPDKVFCVNDKCSEPISKAKTLLDYNSADPDLMSFRGNAEAIVYMKSAGTNPELWYASINGYNGFVNSKFLRENKIYVKNPEVIKPVEDRRVPPTNVEPNKVQQPHEVIEGTTIYTTEATPSMPLQENLRPDAAQGGVSKNIITPSLESVNQGSIAPQQQALPVADLPSNDVHVQSSKIHKQDNVLTQQAAVERPFIIPNNEQLQTTPPTHQASPNNAANSQAAAPSQPSRQETVPQEILNDNVNEAQHETEPTLEMVPQPQALLSSSSNSMTPETIVQIPEKTTLISETPTQPETQGSEQNISVNSLNNLETPTTNDVPSKTNEVPNLNVVATNNQPELLPPLDQVPDLPLQDKSKSQKILTSEEIPSENLNGDSREQLYVSQESLKENEETRPQMQDLPTTTELPVTSHSNHETRPHTQDLPTTTELPVTSHSNHKITDISEETTPTSSETTEAVQQLSTTEAVHQFSTTESPTEQADTSEITIPNVSEISSDNKYSITNEQTTETIPTYSSTESPTEHIQYESTTEEITSPTTESTQNADTEGFLSNVYSTIADLWPSTTEAPPTTESIFNTEAYSEPSPKEDLDAILENIKEPENPHHIYHSEATREPDISNENADEKGFSLLKYFTLAYLPVLGGSEESNALFASPGETCYSNEYPQESKEQNRRLLTFLVTTAGSILLFVLGYYYIDAKRQDGKFVGMVNALQRELLCATKECEILKEELTTTKTKLAGIEDNSFGMDDMVQSLKEEIQELQAQNERLRISLDDNEKLLRVSENTAGELQNTLGEVENTLSELLAERAQSEEHIAELNGKIQAFEEELISVSRDRDSFQLKYVSADTALEEAKKQTGKLEELHQKLADASSTIELQRHEIAALKDAIKEIKGGSSNVDVSSLIDHTEIKAKLAKASEERNALELKFKTEYQERTRLQEELVSTQETLHNTSKQANEASTRLEVLEKYFQERESELVKELNTKETLWLSKQGESASTVEKIELLQQEVQRYKEKCDALNLELAEQESAKRTTVAELESRAHNAWLEARAAKRDAAADREAAAALRRKLASLTQDGTASPHQRIASPLEAALPNGSGAAMLPPPLPLAFLPPPPLLPPLLPPLPRPPPLGRLPSPHPPRYSDRDRYSPDSRYSPESRYSPDSRYSQERRRDSPDSRYSPERRRRSPAFSPRTHRRRTPSRERYPHPQGRSSRQRNGPVLDTETEYGSDSPTRSPRRRRRSYRHSGPSSGSGCSSESDK